MSDIIDYQEYLDQEKLKSFFFGSSEQSEDYFECDCGIKINSEKGFCSEHCKEQYEQAINL